MPGDTSNLEPLLVSPAVGAEMLGIKPWSMFKLIKAGEVESGKYGNRRLVSVQSIRDYASRLLSEGAA